MCDKITPSFPTEIWLNILDWATFVPNVFDTHAPNVFAYPAPWTVEQIQEGLRQTLSTKQNIVRVCKAWNALATRFLYQAVVLHHAKSMKSLLHTLSATASTDINSAQASPTPGFWTRRLDLSSCEKYETPDRDLEELLSILPNLEIFVMRKELEPFTLGLTVFDVLAAMTTRSLRVLDIATNFKIPFRSYVVPDTVLSRQPLHILRVDPCFSMDEHWMQALIPHIEFLHATHKTIGNGLLVGHCTSLSGISIAADDDTAVHSHSMFAPYLTTLELDFLPFGSGVLPSLIAASPNLRNVIADITYMPTILSCDDLPPISNIGLKITRKSEATLSEQAWIVLVCGNLPRVLEQIPSIKVVRFLSKQNSQDLAKHHAGSFRTVCQTSASLFSERKIRFEDRTGCLFHDVPAPV
ncbi:hypothetical protein DFH11DRAFT_1509334 [Phellopilus nigrolimitatus]|nr:hypothetical protein DFH11DRAFT_1509334 [Phellopilus nigrolimitatus]